MYVGETTWSRLYILQHLIAVRTCEPLVCTAYSAVAIYSLAPSDSIQVKKRILSVTGTAQRSTIVETAGTSVNPMSPNVTQRENRNGRTYCHYHAQGLLAAVLCSFVVLVVQRVLVAVGDIDQGNSSEHSETYT